MPSLDIWFDLKVGQKQFNITGNHDLIAAQEHGKITLSTHEPLTRINYPTIRTELHELLDEALDRIQANQPKGEPYVK